MSRALLTFASLVLFFPGSLIAQDSTLRGDRLSKEVRKLLEQENWEALMKLHSAICEIPFDPTAQEHPIRDFYLAMVKDNEESAPPEKFRLGLEAWSEAMPTASVPAIALAHWHVGKAWDARGTEYAHSVTQEGWAGMRNHLKIAADLLDGLREKQDLDVFYYETNMTVGSGQGDLQRAKRSFDEGMQKHPGAHMLQMNRAYYLLPRWYGRNGEWLEFIRSESGKLKGDEKDRLFASMFTSLIIYDEPQMENLTPKEVSRVIRGLELHAVHRYPEGAYLSHGLLNRLARFAAARDMPEVARRAFLGGIGRYSTSWYSFEDYQKALESSGAQAFKNEMRELERAGKLEECEKRWKEVSVYPFPNPNLEQFYRRNGLEERVEDSKLIWDRGKDPEEVPVMEAFAATRVELMKANWDLAEAYGWRFDSIRPHNLTGKNSIFAAAIGQNDAAKLEQVRQSILEMKTNRGNDLLAIDFVAGRKTWEEVKAALEPNSYYGQATLLMALDAIARGDKKTALEIAREVSEHPRIGGSDGSIGLESIYQGSLYRALQLASE